MTAESNQYQQSTTVNTESKVPKTITEAKKLVAQLKDLEDFEAFIVEDIEYDIREINLEILRRQPSGEQEKEELREQLRNKRNQKEYHQNELRAIQRISERFAQHWNFNKRDIEPEGPWNLRQTQDPTGFDFAYSELFKTLEALHQEVTEFSEG